MVALVRRYLRAPAWLDMINLAGIQKSLFFLSVSVLATFLIRVCSYVELEVYTYFTGLLPQGQR